MAFVYKSNLYKCWAFIQKEWQFESLFLQKFTIDDSAWIPITEEYIKVAVHHQSKLRR